MLNGDKQSAQNTSDYIFAPQYVSIVCIGAGISGIALAIELQQKLENYDLCIYEKNPDIGIDRR
jgi:NADH dehydrogenase FAD-containing subunit